MTTWQRGGWMRSRRRLCLRRCLMSLRNRRGALLLALTTTPSLPLIIFRIAVTPSYSPSTTRNPSSPPRPTLIQATKPSRPSPSLFLASSSSSSRARRLLYATDCSSFLPGTNRPPLLLQSSGSVLVAPSLLSSHRSAAVTRYLESSTSTDSPSPYIPVGTSFDVYSDILSGLKKLELPARLERKEAVGVVKMLQGWRGVRESASFASCAFPSLLVLTFSSFAQSSRISLSWRGTWRPTEVHASSGVRSSEAASCNPILHRRSSPDKLDSVTRSNVAQSRCQCRSRDTPSVC